MTKGKITSWSRICVVRPFSEISLMGYNKVIKGFPNITLFVMFLTKVKVVWIKILSLWTCAFDNPKSILKLVPLAWDNPSVVFS